MPGHHQSRGAPRRHPTHLAIWAAAAVIIIILAVGACSSTTTNTSAAVAAASVGPGGHPPTLTGAGHLGIEVADTGAVEAEQTRLAEAGLAAIEERDTTCCYARQDKFWVTGAPNGERWEIYAVLQDSATFWGEGGQQSWDAAQVQLDSGQGQQGARCCGGPQAAGEEDTASSGACCG
jgi:hypothetical protein